MRNVGRCVWLLGLAVGVGVLVAACANSTGSRNASAGGVAVRFGGRVISVGTVTHWIAVEAVLSRELYPQQLPPPGLIPDPPRFVACVAYERANEPPAATGQPQPTTTDLRLACRARYEEVRQHMLQLLIGYQWMEAETRAHGITITPHEIQQAYEREEHVPFHTRTEWERYLHASGQSPADERKLVQFDVEALALREKILHERGITGVREFYQQYPRELAAQTSCSPGYVIAECKQYKGPEPPES